MTIEIKLLSFGDYAVLVDGVNPFMNTFNSKEAAKEALANWLLGK